MQEMQVPSLGWEDPLEEEMAVFLEKYLLYLLEKGMAVFLGSILGSGRSPGEGNFQYSCLENPMDGGTWLGYTQWVCNFLWGKKKPRLPGSMCFSVKEEWRQSCHSMG